MQGFLGLEKHPSEAETGLKSTLDNSSIGRMHKVALARNIIFLMFWVLELC